MTTMHVQRLVVCTIGLDSANNDGTVPRTSAKASVMVMAIKFP